MSEKMLKHTSIIIKESASVSVDGVENVIGFDESYVSLATAVGKIIVEGREMKIECLSKESGETLISGKISGVFYAEEKSPKNFLAKIFK